GSKFAGPTFAPRRITFFLASSMESMEGTQETHMRSGSTANETENAEASPNPPGQSEELAHAQDDALGMQLVVEEDHARQPVLALEGLQHLRHHEELLRPWTLAQVQRN